MRFLATDVNCEVVSFSAVQYCWENCFCSKDRGGLNYSEVVARLYCNCLKKALELRQTDARHNSPSDSAYHCKVEHTTTCLTAPLNKW